MWLTWLADVLRAGGLQVDEMPGWQTRSTRAGGIVSVDYIVWHHTATPRTASDAAVDRLLRDGRTDLGGPLSQLGLRRDGSYVVVAAGRCNHNGLGLGGNDTLGIEAFNDGRGEPWPAVQIDAYDRGTAAIAERLGMSAALVRGHKETNPERKIDPLGIDMDAARVRVSALLAPPPPLPPITTTPTFPEDDMPIILGASGKPAALLSGDRMVPFADKATLGALNKAGVKTVTVSAKDYDRFLAAFGSEK